ncbi:MAG: hypothetical protein J5746_07715, partial [Victivallales bacterium]|nr:hypothetical protein [Victivallales bacterium]
MNRIQAFFTSRKENDTIKWNNYFDIYELYFSKFVDKPIKFLEIGVFRGGSLPMWRAYFHKDSIIVGIDIDPKCKKYEDPKQNCFVEIGDQGDPAFLEKISQKYGVFDIILDDGSHHFKHQIASLEKLWGTLDVNGIYMVEDVQTSYYKSYLGWIDCPWTFIEYSKKLIDELYIYHRADKRPRNVIFANSLTGIYFHTGITVFQKGQNGETASLVSGENDNAQTATFLSNKDFDESFIRHASVWRICLWGLKVIFYTLTGNKERRTEYV